LNPGPPGYEPCAGLGPRALYLAKLRALVIRTSRLFNFSPALAFGARKSLLLIELCKIFFLKIFIFLIFFFYVY